MQERRLQTAVALRPASGDERDNVTVTATDAQNEFGRILNAAAQGRLVVITKHNAPAAVLMSIETFDAFSGVEEAALDALRGEFDALLEGMQTSDVRAGMREAFNASPAELGKAALRAVRRGRGG